MASRDRAATAGDKTADARAGPRCWTEPLMIPLPLAGQSGALREIGGPDLQVKTANLLPGLRSKSAE